MPAWYEVYDNVDIQLMTRKRAATMTAAVTLAVMVSIAVLAVGLEGSVPLAAAIGIIVVAWIAFAWWSMERRNRLRRLVWCIKMSDREIVGYDYARRKAAIDWLDVQSIDLRNTAMIIVGRGDTCLEIAHLFRDFPDLSHRIVSYADQYGIPICIDGRPWQQLDLNDVYPFLSTDAVAP